MSAQPDLRPAGPRALEGVVNFRDFGGAPTRDGRRVRRGRLFRSGHHGEATEADLAALAALDLGLLVDLRRTHERARVPARRPDRFRARLIEHQGPADAGVPPHLAFLTEPDADVARVIAQMTEGYRGYPFDPPYVEVYRAYFPALATAEGAVLVNCHAGKDRTGVLVALTLWTLGVPFEAIRADYLASNEHGRAEERLPQMLDAIRREQGRDISPDLIRQMLRVEAAYLDAAFEAITDRHGSVDAYLEEALGVTPDLRGALKDRYLED